MKEFFKMLLAVLVGCGIVMFAGIFLMLAGITGLVLSGNQTTVSVLPESVLVLNFTQEVDEQSSDAFLDNVLPLGVGSSSKTSLLHICRAIESAATDPAIKFIYMNPQYLSAGPAQIDEIRSSLFKFRQSGKAVITYADAFSQSAYFLSTVSDKILLNPNGSINLKGINITSRYYKDLLDKAGVSVLTVRHGDYKTGEDRFGRRGMSPQDRSQMQDYINDIWAYIRAAISRDRNISEDYIDNCCSNTINISAFEAVDNQLVDRLIYTDQVIDYICDLSGAADEKHLRTISVENYYKARLENRSHSKDKIAVVYAIGDMLVGTGEDGLYSQSFAATLREIRQDSTYKAMVLRINSPGGDPLAASIIARELDLFAQNRPLIVSMGDAAASGGYWIAASGSRIVTSALSLTGSIGVYSVLYNVEEGLKKHLGVNTEVINTHPLSHTPSFFKAWTDKEIAITQQSVDSIYTRFTQYVSQHRSFSAAEMESLAGGRIWSGIRAKEVNLANDIGGLMDAINIAADEAGLTNYQLPEFPQKTGFLEQALKFMDQSKLNPSERLEAILSRSGIVEARIPETLSINF